MHEFWTKIEPTVVTALVSIITAGTPLLIAWLKARTEAQRQAVLGAALHVDATAGNASTEMAGAEKKAAAIQIAASRLPDRLARNEKKLGELVEAVMPDVQAARLSVPPAAS